jgi:hypothetical protein
MIAIAGRRRGLDVVSSHEVGLDGKTDEEQLRWAASHCRALVTRGRRDLSKIAAVFFERGEMHHGVVLIPESLPNAGIGGIVRALEAHARLRPEGMQPFTVDWLTRDA